MAHTIPALGRLRQKGYKFEVSLGYIEHSKLAWDSQRSLFKQTNETFPGPEAHSQFSAVPATL